ncbi:MAG TPA: response regulator transcription factor [Baekduia sp.]|nr:response regulator transcription factor [Baekduia sp.]
MAGFEVVARAGDADDLLRKCLAHRPDLLVADINMPPGHGDDGLVAALEVRRQQPETSVLVLSQYYEERYAAELWPTVPTVSGICSRSASARSRSSPRRPRASRRVGARSTRRSWQGCSAGAERGAASRS